jgi:SAM-dependent methyltransferase
VAVKTWSTPVSVLEASRLVPCALCGGETFLPRFASGAFRQNRVTGRALPRAEAGRDGFSYVRCVRCGLVQINPQPIPADVAARYGTRYGKDYLAYELENESAFLRLQELALRDAGFFDLEKAGGPGSALDIGCATGALLSLLKNRGWTVRGVEISRPQAEYCRSRGLAVSGVPLEENRFPPECFDAVSASHLIEHLNDPGAFVREIHRLLKKGGRFYVTTPNISGFQARLFGNAWRSAIFDHLYLFSRKTLSSLLESAGLYPERCVTWGGIAAGIAPKPIKALLDKNAKRFGFGDVMIIRAVKA